MNADKKPSPDAGTIGNIGICLIQTIIFVYDWISYPIYYAVQRPWVAKRKAEEIRAVPISSSSTQITYEPKPRFTPELKSFEAKKISTMTECWIDAVERFSHKKCLGTRDILEETDEEQPDGKIFKKWKMGSYKWKTFCETDQMACNFGKGLREIGVEYKENVCIFAESKAEWMISALGCFKQTMPLVTLYANLGEDAICHGVNQTEVRVLITTHDLLPKFRNVLPRTPSVTHLIYFEDQLKPTDTTGFKEGVTILSFKQILEMGVKSSKIGTPPKTEDTAIIMYTSGSTGVPKGVILPHESLITTIKAFLLVVTDPIPDDTYLGYLPLAHIYELLSEMTMLIQGIKVGYSSPTTMIDKSTKVMKGSKGDCSILRPTLMCAVPLVLDRIYKGINENVNKKGPFLRALMHFCYRYKSYYRKLGMSTPIMDALIFRSMKAIVGGKIRVVVSGGAPLSSETHDFVCCALGIPIHQGYGLTESCSCATVMHREELSTGRVGPPGQGIKIRLVNWEEGGYKVTDKNRPRGEIEIGGGNVAHGYFKLPEKTKEDFYIDENGVRWFKTGDIGEFAEDGTLKIIDRKKDLVKLQYGEYVSLGKVETVIKTCPLVENICAYGDSNKTYCIALIIPDRNKLMDLAQSLGINSGTFEDYCSNSKITAEMLKLVCSHAKKTGLEKFELPGAITLVTDTWTPESGLVTAAFKLKRKPIQEFYQNELKKMYDV